MDPRLLGNVETPVAVLMNSEVANLILSIVGFAVIWTTSIIGGVIWLNTKFRSVERAIYREDERHRKTNDARFNDLLLRVQRLELRVFGFTEAP